MSTRQLWSQINSISSGITSIFSSRERPFYRRLWFWASLGIGGTMIGWHYFIGTIDQSLPEKSELKVSSRGQTLTIKAVDGSILQQQGEATRERLRLEQIPNQLKQAFIASEDRRFENHHGIDPQGILRAALNNVRSQTVVEGGSTITQQLARILFLKQEQTIWRKLKEVRLAQKIEQELTKNEIIERYLNLVYLGSGAYGVADAAWVYFSKSVEQLTLAEAAMIAGLAPAPSLYSPMQNPTVAIQRRNMVLQRMYEDELITAAQRQTSSQESLNLNSSLPKRLQVESPYFASYILQELPKYVSPELLTQGGLVVETTLNPTWQQAAETAVAKTLKNQGRWQNFTQASLVAIDPRNGEIQAMVGGKDFDKNQFNRVTQAQRQPGSTFKAFVYAAAIATGKSPNDSYLDAPFVVDKYEPQNYGKSFSGSMSIRNALTRSINVIAVKVLLDVGFQPIINTARKLGIKSELQPTYSLALGSHEVNLLELTNAYGSFATQGLYIEAHGIRRILNRQGEVVWSSNKFQHQRVLDPSSAGIMTWMLRNVVEAGTGGPAQLKNRPVAGKTGTSDESRDLWFIGYIPQVVTGVWLGNDNNRPTSGASGSAAYTWRAFMEKAVEGMPVEKFPERPKLQGRVGSIKAQPIKPKSVQHRSISSAANEPSPPTANVTRSSRSRRRRSRPQVTNNAPARVSSPPRRRRRVEPKAAPRAITPRPSPPASRSSSSSTPQPSWRERLRPGSTSSD
ncbi:transglycosylase domain-containing protein [Nodularia sphaerocarpa]|uniref:transglycosylase domain-containing protein n=1 Tax=Nodularia sphaerocarpa TaxID=137816 RepID=UPI001EFC1A2E|nr:penicillin-binding protein 1A [Nodularia sphaerocarpa]MDB9375855.1 penicillin-binding protein 1A [Nodularia sphaerocarpa CS-585]MDB9376318.1 penicillin-binding protein 1A [Nodularia sphaerocarpa CS-585A2]ULP71828.1 Penicillin-binding protein 2D [Nodularia sphaerocarpa UHCC 0038]